MRGTTKIDTGLQTTGYRVYDSAGNLVTWIQRRCKICQRFLSVDQNIYCSVHKDVKDKVYRDSRKGKEARQREYEKRRIKRKEKRNLRFFA
jgi:hypothetical protein